jgi:hypothetical protein
MQYEDAMPCQHVVPMRSSLKEKLLPHIGGVRIVGDNSHSSPWSVLTRQSYTIVVSILAGEHNIHMTYITIYPPSGARVFNTV